jgi:hypothetical protein
MTSQRTDTSPGAEGAGLLIALALLLTVAVVSVLAAPDFQPQPNSLQWQTMSPSQAFITLQPYFSGPACAALLRQAQFSIDGQTAVAVVPQIGTFEVRGRNLGLFLVRPLTASNDREDCRFNPRYVGPVT